MSNKLLKSSLTGVLTAIAMSVVLLLVFNYICYINSDPDKFLTVFALAALYISTFFGGFAAARKNKQAGLLCGFLTGAIFLLLIIVLSISLKSDGISSAWRYLLFAAILPVSIIGGLAGIPSSNKRRKKSKK